MSQIQKGTLVKYKSSAALVTAITDKIEISTEANNLKRVRSKDVEFIHLGPVANFDFLQKLPAIKQENLEDVCEMLQGETSSLTELAELLFTTAEPEQVWATLQLLEEDTYFTGDITKIQARSLADAKDILAQNNLKAQAKQAEQEFIERLKSVKLKSDDFKKISDIEELALGTRDNSINLKKAGFKQDMPTAHQYLVKTGYWDKYYNPYPQRHGLDVERESIDVPEEFCIERVDLSRLECFAIDDVGNTDPDDAISIDGDKFWVHVADVATLVRPSNLLDLHAKEQPSNLYLPETTCHMLPRQITDRFGLGLNSLSNALSVCFSIKDDEPVLEQIVLSNIKVTRLTYAEVDEKIENDPFNALYQQAMCFKQKRLENGAINLELPQTSVKMQDDIVSIKQLEPHKSRELVMEFMLMAGAVVGKKMLKEKIPFIYSTQASPVGDKEYSNTPDSFAAMIALRGRLQKSRPDTEVSKHNGLGLEVYCQLTSPLRRYTDLCNHQQLHAYLEKTQTLSKDEIDQKIASYNELSGKIVRAERSSNLHFKIIYLSQNPDWQGEAIIVENEGHKSKILIPSLGMETKIKISGDNELNQVINLKLSSTNIYEQTANFKICH